MAVGSSLSSVLFLFKSKKTVAPDISPSIIFPDKVVGFTIVSLGLSTSFSTFEEELPPPPQAVNNKMNNIKAVSFCRFSKCLIS